MTGLTANSYGLNNSKLQVGFSRNSGILHTVVPPKGLRGLESKLGELKTELSTLPKSPMKLYDKRRQELLKIINETQGTLDAYA